MFRVLLRLITQGLFPILTLLCLAGLILPLVAPVPIAVDPRILATLAAFFFTVFSYFHRSWEAERQSRQQHTLKMLFDTRLSSEFRANLEARKHCFPEDRPVEPDHYFACLTAKRNEDLTDKAARQRRQSAEALRSLLNYYEFLSLAVLRGDLDDDMLRNTIRGIMCNLVRDCHGLLIAHQARSPRAYQHLIALYERWRDADYPGFPSLHSRREWQARLFGMDLRVSVSR
jgi:hypothetical protein